MAGFNGTTSALRPRAEVAVQLSRAWQASAIVATHPWQDASGSDGALQSALDTLDAFPTLMMRDGRPVLENDLHEELAIDHALSTRADLIASVFHDLSSHTAVIGRGGPRRARISCRTISRMRSLMTAAPPVQAARGWSTARRSSDNLTTTVVYAYAGALAPNGVISTELREELATRYRQSLAAAIHDQRARAGRQSSPRATNGSAAPTVSQPGCVRRVALSSGSLSEHGNSPAAFPAFSRDTWKSRPIWATCSRRDTSQSRLATAPWCLSPPTGTSGAGLSLQF